MGRLWWCSLEQLALWLWISVAKCQVSWVKNQGFRLWPKDVGIWIVILSECCQFPSSVVSKERKQGRDFWLGWILCSSLPCGTVWCVICFGKISWGGRRGEKSWASFCFSYLFCCSPSCTSSHDWNMFEKCYCNYSSFTLKGRFHRALKQTYDP